LNLPRDDERLAVVASEELVGFVVAGESLERALRLCASRRAFLADAARLAASGMLASLTNPFKRVYAAPGPSIGIVGAGLAGLVCADKLGMAGIQSVVYEASTGIGGRCRSLKGVFPGRTIELGGDFIDQSHKTILKLARRFGLTQLNLFKTAGEVVYRIDGRIFPERVIVDLFRDVVHQMERDSRLVTAGLNARLPFTPDDRRLDTTNLEAYLVSIGADPVLVKAIQSVYGGEYGQPIHLQSGLNFLLFVKLSRSRHIHWFGATNAERFTTIEGNDAIAKGLADGLADGQIQFGMDLSGVRKASDGRIALTFGNKTERTHDAVVLAIPATVIRSRVALHLNLGIAPQTRSAIERLQYGDNTKTMYQFTSDRPFAGQLGGDGASYTTDPALPNVQVTFPSKTGAGDPTRPVIVDYSFGERGRNQQSIDPNGELFLQDLDEVFPGVLDTADRRSDGSLLLARKHWPSEPNALGSYTCNQPGYFTEMEGWLAEPAGNLFFAGEHTDSFHNFQGFLEGAASSGERSADLLLQRINRSAASLDGDHACPGCELVPS
jgi:monoamine oxidase